MSPYVWFDFFVKRHSRVGVCSSGCTCLKMRKVTVEVKWPEIGNDLRIMKTFFQWYKIGQVIFITNHVTFEIIRALTRKFQYRAFRIHSFLRNWVLRTFDWNSKVFRLKTTWLIPGASFPSARCSKNCFMFVICQELMCWMSLIKKISVGLEYSVSHFPRPTRGWNL